MSAAQHCRHKCLAPPSGLDPAGDDLTIPFMQSFSAVFVCLMATLKETCPFCSGFMVNTSYIGSSANQIGMTLSSWQACYQCGQPLGSCTAVQGGSPYDQFSSFRSNSLASVLANAGSNCSWLGNSVMTNGSVQYPVQLMACDYPSSQLSITLRLNATAFGVIPTLPALSLVNSGQFTWLPGNLTGQLCTAMWYRKELMLSLLGFVLPLCYRSSPQP